MAIAPSTDLIQQWESTTVMELREETMMLQLTSNEFTSGWVGGAHTGHIPKPTWGEPDGSQSEGVKATSRARKGNWASPIPLDQEVIDLTRKGGYSSANVVPYEDALESPWPMVEETRSRQRYALGFQIDRGVLSEMQSDLTATPTAYGSTTNYIARTGAYAPKTAAARALPRQILDAFDLKLQRAGANGPGANVGNRYCLMPPEVFNVFALDMLTEKYQWDLLTKDLLTKNAVLAEQGYKGRYKGIDIFAYNAYKVPGSGNSTRWAGLCGVKRGYTAAVRAPISQYFTPQTNQISDAPSHLLRTAGDWGGVLLEPKVFTEFTIFKSASDS